jgi:CheY-like chemotaxis protein
VSSKQTREKHDTVLLVDADEQSRRILEVSLRQAGFLVAAARGGSEALAKIDAVDPVVVISDTALAESDGFTLCKLLRASARWSGTPFIFLTKERSLQGKVRALELGVEDYLTRPIFIQEVLTRIQMLLKRRVREQLADPQGRTTFQGSLSDLGLIDLIQILEMGNKSGRLQLVRGEGDKLQRGEVCFSKGQIVGATCGAHEQENAIQLLLAWSEGSFAVWFEEISAGPRLGTSNQALLLESIRRADERAWLCEQLPDLATVLNLDFNNLAERIGEIPDEVNAILRLFNGRNTIQEVVEAGVFSELETLGVVAKLFVEGMLINRDQPRGGCLSSDRTTVESFPVVRNQSVPPKQVLQAIPTVERVAPVEDLPRLVADDYSVEPEVRAGSAPMTSAMKGEDVLLRRDGASSDDLDPLEGDEWKRTDTDRGWAPPEITSAITDPQQGHDGIGADDHAVSTGAQAWDPLVQRSTAVDPLSSVLNQTNKELQPPSAAVDLRPSDLESEVPPPTGAVDDKPWPQEGLLARQAAAATGFAETSFAWPWDGSGTLLAGSSVSAHSSPASEPSEALPSSLLEHAWDAVPQLTVDLVAQPIAPPAATFDVSAKSNTDVLQPIRTVPALAPEPELSMPLGSPEDGAAALLQHVDSAQHAVGLADRSSFVALPSEPEDAAAAAPAPNSVTGHTTLVGVTAVSLEEVSPVVRQQVLAASEGGQAQELATAVELSPPTAADLVAAAELAGAPVPMDPVPAVVVGIPTADVTDPLLHQAGTGETLTKKAASIVSNRGADEEVVERWLSDEQHHGPTIAGESSTAAPVAVPGKKTDPSEASINVRDEGFFTSDYEENFEEDILGRDPKGRRRRISLAVAAAVLVAGSGAGYLIYSSPYVGPGPVEKDVTEYLKRKNDRLALVGATSARLPSHTESSPRAAAGAQVSNQVKPAANVPAAATEAKARAGSSEKGAENSSGGSTVPGKESSVGEDPRRMSNEAQQAKPVLEQAKTTERGPGSAPATKAEAVAGQQGKRESAATGPTPPAASAWLGEADALMKKNKKAAAYRLYRKALKADPKSWQALQHVALEAMERGQMKQAVALARQALALKNEAAYAHLILGSDLALRGKKGEAATAFRSFVTLCPDCRYAKDVRRSYQIK